MGRSKTASFVAERRIYTKPWEEDLINRDLNLANRVYNNGVRHYRPIAEKANNDTWLKYCQKKLAVIPDDDEHADIRKEWASEICAVLSAYGLTEYDIHEYLIRGRQKGSCHSYPSTMTQKVGTALYQSIKKAALRGTEIHFRKFGATNTLDGKKAGENIIYNDVNGTVKYKGHVMELKPVRAKDIWLQEALTHRVKYCRIVRRPHGENYRYFLQIVLEGLPPKKLVKGNGVTGLDPGVSTMTTCSDTGCRFDILAPEIDRYDREIRRYSQSYERRRRLANPENYNEDGTIKKDTKTFRKYWVHTKGEKRALMLLKTAYRKKSEHVKQSGNYISNRIIEGCGTLIKEPMNYIALAKKSKETSHRDRKEIVHGKNGTVREIYKFRRKKRFGKSILSRAPGQFITRLKYKCVKYDVRLIDIDATECRASQLNHVTGKTKKPLLSERTKIIDGHTVQRDLYSAFLIRHALPDGSGIDCEACTKDFDLFLKNQRDTVWQYLLGDYRSNNFGMTLADI